MLTFLLYDRYTRLAVMKTEHGDRVLKRPEHGDHALEQSKHSDYAP